MGCSSIPNSPSLDDRDCSMLTAFSQATNSINCSKANHAEPAYKSVSEAGFRLPHPRGHRVHNLLSGKRGGTVRRFLYTEIDDAARFRLFRLLGIHTQTRWASLIILLRRFCFASARLGVATTASSAPQSHWHIEDKRIFHTDIERGRPPFHRTVERSHR